MAQTSFVSVAENPFLNAALLILIGCLALTGSSYVAIPMVPVPITGQTLAVTLIGALYGWRLGMLTIAVWLGLGAAGLPVFSGGSGGADAFTGPTAGYLVAFVFAAGATGWLVEQGWNAARWGLAFAAMLIGNAICLTVGAGWLASQIGTELALSNGLYPFLPGAVIKSAMGAGALVLVRRWFP